MLTNGTYAVGDCLVNEQTGQQYELVKLTSKTGYLCNGETFRLKTDKIVGKSEYVAIAPPAVKDAWHAKKIKQIRDNRERCYDILETLKDAHTERWDKDDCDQFLALAEMLVKKYS